MRALVLIALLFSGCSRVYDVFEIPVSRYVTDTGPLRRADVDHEYWDQEPMREMWNTGKGHSACILGWARWACFKNKNDEGSNCVISAWRTKEIVHRYNKPYGVDIPNSITAEEWLCCTEPDLAHGLLCPT